MISDSVDYLSVAQGTGSVSKVDILEGQEGRGKGEGTAMLEIIHRIAPDAELGFATGGDNPITMYQNIVDLADIAKGKCNIIVDDLLFFDESPFQDGIIASGVDEISKKGVLYFSSAANGGNIANGSASTWEGDFRAHSVAITLNGKVGFLHEFSLNTTDNSITQVYPVFGGGEGRADLFWSDPLGASTNEYDLYTVDARGNIVFSGNTIMDGHKDPHQSVQLDVGQKLWVFQAPGAKDRYLHLDTNRSQLNIATSGSTHGHNASGAANAFSVAAVSAKGAMTAFNTQSTENPERYSSDGPRRMFYSSDGSELTPGNLGSTGGVLLQKPDITAADCVSTDVPGFAPFCGTSAAAPRRPQSPLC